MPPPEAETQRLFFALWPPVELGRELYRLGGRALGGVNGRRIPPESIHLTLAFLGSVTTKSRDCIESAAAAVKLDPFTLTLEQMGCWRKPGILWVGPNRVPEPLSRLVLSLVSGLSGCGFEPDKRAFAAHLTLARRMHAACETALKEPVSWEIDRFHLVQSHTLAAGARYEILRSWPFRSPAG